MINVILLECALVLMSLYYFYKLRRGFHMFQLESYKPERYRTWMKKNKKDIFCIRELLLIIPLVIFIFYQTAGLITQIVIMVLLWLSRDIYKEKKPLVVTKRVKRQYITAGLIAIIFIAICNIAVFKFGLVVQTIGIFVFDLIIFLSMYLVFVVQTINSPVENSINKKFYKKAENKLKEMPNLKVIGITGSYGKTSTKYILSTILNQKYNVLITPGNYNTLLGVVKTINESLKSTDQVFICEMGAKNIGDIKEICDLVHPQYGVLTSIGPQHLETFKTLDNVRKTKLELIDSIPEDGMAFVNYDDENIRESNIAKNNIKYGIKNQNDVYAYDIKLTEDGSMFNVHTPNGDVKDIKTKLLGEHNVLNITGAVGIAASLGLTADEIKLGITYLKPVEHRLELRKNPNGLIVIDDAYNSNVKGASRAFEVLKMFKNRTRIIVTPGIVELGEETEKYNQQLGQNAANCADYVILVGKKQAPPIKDGLLSMRFPEDKIFVVDTINDAIKKWQEFPAENTVVLLENDLPDNYL